MMINYCEVDVRENGWLSMAKNFHEFRPMDKLAVDAVLYDLNTAYEKTDGYVYKTMSEISDFGYWSGNYYYNSFDNYVIYIDNTFMVFDCMYIAKNNDIILVAYPLVNATDDNWDGVVNIPDDLENHPKKHFIISY